MSHHHTIYVTPICVAFRLSKHQQALHYRIITKWIFDLSKVPIESHIFTHSPSQSCCVLTIWWHLLLGRSYDYSTTPTTTKNTFLIIFIIFFCLWFSRWPLMALMERDLVYSDSAFTINCLSFGYSIKYSVFYFVHSLIRSERCNNSRVWHYRN